MVVVAVALAMALAVMVAVVMVLVRWSMMINDASGDDGRLMTTFVFLCRVVLNSQHIIRHGSIAHPRVRQSLFEGHARDAQVCTMQTWHVWEPKGSGQHPRAHQKRSSCEHCTPHLMAL